MSSIFKKDTIIESFAGYNLVTRKAGSDGFVNISAGDLMRCPEGRPFVIASTVSTALANNECPHEAYALAKKFGHNTHQVVPLPYGVNRSETHKTPFLLINLDTKYKFEGKIFYIVQARNDNFKLILC